jgi:Ni/Fe-hydrogenase subunit HybB-like protein
MHEIVEYSPSLTEWKLTVGIWAMGIGVFTVALKITAHVLSGRSRMGARVGGGS